MGVWMERKPENKHNVDLPTQQRKDILRREIEAAGLKAIEY